MPIGLSEILRRKIQDDDAFVVSERETVAASGTTNLHLKNPADSETRFWVIDITVYGTGDFAADVHDGFDVAPNGGTPMDIQSLLLDTAGNNNNGDGTSSKNVSFTANSTHATAVVGGGAAGASIGGDAKHAVVCIEPGREIVVEITNTSSGSNDYAITMTYYETP